MRSGIKGRIERLEQQRRNTTVGAHPSPAAGVIFAGERDPVAIVHALGLEHMGDLMVQVLPEGSPDDPPRLVGPLSERGASRQCPEHAELRRRFAGAGWSFQWRCGQTGFVLDWSTPSGVREYECVSRG